MEKEFGLMEEDDWDNVFTDKKKFSQNVCSTYSNTIAFSSQILHNQEKVSIHFELDQQKFNKFAS